jgi:two-component system nitrate/nitrite sensor histidine kinase NarX
MLPADESLNAAGRALSPPARPAGEGAPLPEMRPELRPAHRAGRQWNLGIKLALVQLPFLMLAALSIALTLWVSWQLDGGAAAVNEAGRMRMQAYRMSLSVSTGDRAALTAQVAEFEDALALLRTGDPDRPLFVPWDDTVRERFAVVESDWQRFRARWTAVTPPPVDRLAGEVAQFTANIGSLVHAIEGHMSRWTALMHLLQMAMLGLMALAIAVLVYTGYLFVLEPVARLKEAIGRIQQGDLDARVDHASRDEFGTLAEGFNGMAGHLQSIYRNLESRVAEKTAELQEKRERLEALYDVTALVARAASLDELARGFVARIARVAHADGVALRLRDDTGGHFGLLASEGLPPAAASDCTCGIPAQLADGAPQVRAVALEASPSRCPQHGAGTGFATLVLVPVQLHERVTGSVELYFHARYHLSDAERSLLEALTAHLAAAMDNIRLNALEKEAAVSQERTFLARELHDSIAQSLAFLKIQVQLMHDALASGDARRVEATLEEIDAGVRESYGDVRELLMHFRTRAGTEGIESALQTTLRKFEHQSGLRASLAMQGHGLPLSPDLQVQVLHILQEALSNVRKHARATQVWVDVSQQPQWRFEVRDDGCGFDAGTAPDETHVGLRIMAERAERIGAELECFSTPGRGTSVVLTLPTVASPAVTTAPIASVTP